MNRAASIRLLPPLLAAFVLHAAPAGPAEHVHEAAGPVTPIPPLTDADRAAAVAPSSPHPGLENAIQGMLLLNRLELWDAEGELRQAWEADGWIGTDLDRLWLRSDGERQGGATEAADLELLYGHSFSTRWDVVAGLRHDFRSQDSRSFVALGIQGLAPQWFEISATAYLGEGGRSAARLEVEYELLFSGRLILQPLLEADLYGKSDPMRGIGSGLSTAELGLRLRYEFTRRFAPYIGVGHERAFGRTATLRRAAGEAVHDTRVVLGLRTWF